MPKFMKPLVVKKVNDNEWEVYEELEYHVGSKDSEEVIIVPKGTLTDFASIPKILWNILPPHTEVAPISVIHDYIYSLRGKLPDKTYTREEGDKIFLEGMQVLGVPLWKRYTMFYAVRTAGFIYWNKK